jgi:Tol biopolymer transport system component
MRQDDAGLWQLWQASSDLRQQTQLTSENANSGWPAGAPSGRRIAFDSDRADPDPNDDAVITDITIRPNGSGLIKLTPSRVFSGDPAYSPDRRTIAFNSDQGDCPPKQGISR